MSGSTEVLKDINVSKWSKVFCIPGMLLFGTSTVVIAKIMFNMEGIGSRPPTVHKFTKPWFQTDGMFLGMFLCLLVYEIKNLIEYITSKLGKDRGSETVSLLNKPTTENSLNNNDKANKHWMSYVYVAAPGICDLLATATMNIGLVWLPPSIWQMLRGSMVIFSAIFSVIFLKRKLEPFHWTGIGIVCFGLIVVAVSCIFGDTTPTDQVYEMRLEIAGIILVVVAQIIQASQIVIEEYLLKNIELHPFLIVGLEGFWGGLLCTIMLIPITYIKSKDYHEDSLDTIYMLGHNPKIVGAALGYVFAILGYNLFGMLVTQVFTAVHRTILEAIRTACIWVVNLFIYYVITPKFGELWNAWSFLELFGFLLLLLGMFIYNKVIILWPGLYYEPLPVKPKPKEDSYQSPSIDEYTSSSDQSIIYSPPPSIQTPATRVMRFIKGNLKRKGKGENLMKRVDEEA